MVKFARNGTVNESDVAEMTCAGYGIPQPTVTWSLKGNTLTNSSRVTVVRGNLRIGDVSRNDAGLYSCTVENYLGKEMSSAYLTVQGEIFQHDIKSVAILLHLLRQKKRGYTTQVSMED